MPSQESQAPLFHLDPPSIPRVLADAAGYQNRRRAIPRPPVAANRPPDSDWPPLIDGPEGPPTLDEDPQLHAVADALMRLDPTGVRTAWVIRQALDQVYDGRRTGRWDYTQLMKTEKTHVGTLVEIWMAREFEFEGGDELDFKIAGEDVDCKWSRSLYQWEIPLEMHTRGDRIAILMWGNEDNERWVLGLLRISESVLRPAGRQRDGKRRLNRAGCQKILWIHRTGIMVANTLLRYPAVAMDVAQEKSGQAAVSRLFSELPGVLVNQVAVETAAQQIDSTKRVRDARKHLRGEGLVIFGHYAPHPQLARDLGLPVPTLGWFVSAKLHPWSEGDVEPNAVIGESRWRLARPGEEVVVAPELPNQGKSLG